MGKLLNTTRVIDRDGKLYPRDVRDLFDRIDILLQERQQAGSISNNAFGAAWNGVTDIGASKNAIYDKITAMDLVSADKVAGVTGILPIVIGGTATNPNVTAPTVVIAPATNTDNNVPQWNGADSKTLKNGRAIGIADTNLVQVDDAAAADNEYAKFTASGIEGRTYAEVLADIGAENATFTGSLTAYATGGQANATQLNLGENLVTVVAATSDSCKLPATAAVGEKVRVTNKGVSIMDLFPASGDDLGQGVDTAMDVPPDVKATLVCTVANSTWVVIGHESVVSLEYAFITLSGDQTAGLAVDTPIRFNTLSGGNMTIDGANYRVLFTKGKSYRMKAVCKLNFSAATGDANIQFYNITGTAYVGISSRTTPTTYTSNFASQPECFYAFTPTEDTYIDVRFSLHDSADRVESAMSYWEIEQILA
jgi:hypothetical protein